MTGAIHGEMRHSGKGDTVIVGVGLDVEDGEVVANWSFFS